MCVCVCVCACMYMGTLILCFVTGYVLQSGEITHKVIIIIIIIIIIVVVIYSTLIYHLH